MANAQWIWFPGDFEMMLNLDVHSSRYERGSRLMSVWRVDGFYQSVSFRKTVAITKEQTVKVCAQGEATMEINPGIYVDEWQDGFTLSPGEYKLQITVYNCLRVPSIYVDAPEIQSGDSWIVGCLDNSWHKPGCAGFTDPLSPPCKMPFEITELTPVSIRQTPEGSLVDFGREIMARVSVMLRGKGHALLCYGESETEALDVGRCETTDKLLIDGEEQVFTPITKALRYVHVICSPGVSAENVLAHSEMLPLTNRGAFSCDDPLLNDIYDVALHTLHLNSREFFFDGIKRDRWVWSGDAYQSYLLNHYSFFDNELNRRTSRVLRGRDPMVKHMNNIQDYTLYWLIALWDTYLYTKDLAYLEEIYESAEKVVDFCMQSVDEQGFFHSRPDDWVFIDWAPIDNTGLLSFEQLLFARAMQVMGMVSRLLGKNEQAATYRARFDALLPKIFASFWSDKFGCFTHGPANAPDAVVTKYTNMFAIFFDYLDDEKREQVIRNALLNEAVLPITTPYMRFYELAALCEAGEMDAVTKFLREYWGGMLALGATSFWEAYDPTQSGAEHFAMYGRPYGKSLCHAWSAGPILLYGKYYLGVRPTAPGYARFEVSPQLGGLGKIKGTIPTPDGQIHVTADKDHLQVCNESGGEGTVYWKDEKYPIAPQSTLEV